MLLMVGNRLLRATLVTPEVLAPMMLDRATDVTEDRLRSCRRSMLPAETDRAGALEGAGRKSILSMTTNRLTPLLRTMLKDASEWSPNLFRIGVTLSLRAVSGVR